MLALGNRLKSDTGGTIAVWSALIAMPLLMAVTYALDLKWAERNVQELKSSADAAVLAAVNNNAIPLRDKDEFAVDVFRTNYMGAGQTELEVDVEPDAVRMVVRAKFPQTLTSMIGLNDINASVASTAELTTEQVICVLALNPGAQGAVSFSDDVEFEAPTCSVYANSTHNQAVISQGTDVPMAKGFCAGGGADGQFAPFANSQCRQIADPYAGKQAPVREACTVDPAIFDVRTIIANPLESIDGGLGTNGPAVTTTTVGTVLENPPARGSASAIPGTDSTLVNTPRGTHVIIHPGDSPNVVDDRTVLYPGTYCGGLTIAGDRVTLQPGEYYMDGGPFVVKDNARVSGDKVVIALGGRGAVMRVEEEGELDLKAPTVGAFKGLVIMQDVRNRHADSAGNAAVLRSRVGSGGDLSVTGTVYLPTHKLEVKGDGSRVGAQAPSTSFIADTVAFSGSGRIRVAVDHEEAGLPPVLPRSEDGARLTE